MDMQFVLTLAKNLEVPNLNMFSTFAKKCELIRMFCIKTVN